MDTHVVIMAGGVGSRLWPVSTPQKPKQFIDILGIGKTLIQMTVDRFLPVCNISNFWVVTSEAYVGIVREQLPLIPEDHILAEPEPRNTAPCIAYASWKIAAVNPNANIVVTPADALVINVHKFAAAIRKALNFTDGTDKIVTVGIEPSRPETGYGYICAEEKNPDEVVTGTVKELAEKYDVDLMTMVGFLDGINDSLKEKNPIEEMEEDTVVNLGFDKELLYKNMVAAGADWLYGLEEWEPIFDEEKRKELYKEQKASGTVVKPAKIYPNDPCPCGSGKKYKKCHGKNR